MSAYTSFVAIDSEVRNPGGDGGETVLVPLPLPDQVSPLAAPGHAYVTGTSLQVKAREALSGFLCRTQAVAPSAGTGRDERAWSRGSRSDAARPAAGLEEEIQEKEQGDSSIERIRIHGTLDEGEVRPVLEEALEAWARDKGLANIQGTVVLALAVDADGRVARAWVRNKEALDEEALRLLLEKAGGLLFPESEARSILWVTFSL